MLNAQDAYQIAYDVLKERDAAELTKIMSAIEKNARAGLFRVWVNDGISDKVKNILVNLGYDVLKRDVSCHLSTEINWQKNS